MRHLLTGALAMSCAVLVCTGTLLLLSRGTAQELSVADTRAVHGGAAAVWQYVFVNCPASTAPCNQIQCGGANGNFTCAVNTTETVQLRANYPFNMQQGALYNQSAPANYHCSETQACGNPCIQSTVAPFHWYCNGPVGPQVQSNNGGVTGSNVAEG
jgi:hypothetical protein